jgi:hypothetical protein
MEDHPGPSLCLFAEILRMVLSIAGLETLAGFIFRLDLRIQGTISYPLDPWLSIFFRERGMPLELPGAVLAT